MLLGISVAEHLMCEIERIPLPAAATIIGQDGSVWAPWPVLTPEVWSPLAGLNFAEPGWVAPTGLDFDGTEHMVIQGKAWADIKGKKTLEMLGKQERVLVNKAAAEYEKAKEFIRAKNERAAKQCLKTKRLYEQQIQLLGNFQLRIHEQMIMLEGAKATAETVDALRTGAAAMKAIHESMNIDYVDITMDEINEPAKNMRQIQKALSAPVGAAAGFDEDELEAELEELEGAELEEQLLQPATTSPAAPVHVSAGRVPARASPQKSKVN